MTLWLAHGRASPKTPEANLFPRGILEARINSSPSGLPGSRADSFFPSLFLFRAVDQRRAVKRARVTTEREQLTLIERRLFRRCVFIAMIARQRRSDLLFAQRRPEIRGERTARGVECTSMLYDRLVVILP